MGGRTEEADGGGREAGRPAVTAPPFGARPGPVWAVAGGRGRCPGGADTEASGASGAVPFRRQLSPATVSRTFALISAGIGA